MDISSSSPFTTVFSPRSQGRSTQPFFIILTPTSCRSDHHHHHEEVWTTAPSSPLKDEDIDGEEMVDIATAAVMGLGIREYAPGSEGEGLGLGISMMDDLGDVLATGTRQARRREGGAEAEVNDASPGFEEWVTPLQAFSPGPAAPPVRRYDAVRIVGADEDPMEVEQAMEDMLGVLVQPLVQPYGWTLEAYAEEAAFGTGWYWDDECYYI
ncbi:hypothetical protein PUNSTDRAFT_43191 [Punctularia strigosozonata HHB-11173 SS5]|uniref:uncharacterized protein n=1 Tax=Punctularia strigosozonata (strain HHB-11173) TaxID=741275 RepID=UPI00044165C0|nr:uncharacterized protein PUNSTDRAFT_43191 [Punctularia strigosozonata HHB-11173 SS5]EIN10199.1 hypothetical protein PUNSTDRAFT_43191 [Punctularia strigosozonata HHB-11173 SS5]